MLLLTREEAGLVEVRLRLASIAAPWSPASCHMGLSQMSPREPAEVPDLLAESRDMPSLNDTPGLGLPIPQAPRPHNELVAGLTLAAMPFYIACAVLHVCMDGHLRHPPYAALHFVSDCLWICAFSVALVLAFRSTLANRIWYLAYLPLLASWRLFFGSMGGMLFAVEAPMAMLLLVKSGMDCWRMWSARAPGPAGGA